MSDLHEYQRKIVEEMVSKGHRVAIVSHSHDAVSQLTRRLVETADGVNPVIVFIDEMHDAFVDHVGTLAAADYKLMYPKVSLDLSSVADDVRALVASLAEEVRERLYPERKYIAMNDWRNNKRGRKHR